MSSATAAATTFRKVRRSCWDETTRVEDLDRHGIDVQVISPVPVTLADWAGAADADRFLAAQNDRIAEVVAGSAGGPAQRSSTAAAFYDLGRRAAVA